jgi:hypothetical protein
VELFKHVGMDRLSMAFHLGRSTLLGCENKEGRCKHVWSGNDMFFTG